MNMTKIATAAVLVLSVATLGSCKKTVYNNVDQVFSTVYNIKSTDWVVDNGSQPVNWYKVDLSVPEVDDVVIANGAVVVYLSFDGGNTWDALPEEALGITYNAFFLKGVVRVGYGSRSVSQPDLPTGDIRAKVVILDGTSLD